MRARSRPLLYRELAGHSLIGAELGTLLALSLFVSDAHHIFAMIANSSAPKTNVVLFFVIFTSIFTVGSTMTGLVFSLMEAESSKHKRR